MNCFDGAGIVRKGSRQGFTLVELLVVIGIISVLMGLLLPALGVARENAKTITCLSNLRQLAVAAQIYCDRYKGSYPIAYYDDGGTTLRTSYAWDFNSIRNLTTGGLKTEPGLLWDNDTSAKVQQCPAYDGKSNTLADPFTGYNYNTSYIGHGQYESIVEPARSGQIRYSSRCALFGDGQYGGGANKFMRAPLPNPGDATFTARASGTQGFRHRRRTNVVFCDGHGESLLERHLNSSPSEIPKIADGTGFLSVDNRFYSTE